MYASVCHISEVRALHACDGPDGSRGVQLRERNVGRSPTIDDADRELDLGFDLDCNPGDLTVSLGCMGVTERQQTAGNVDGENERGAGGHTRLVDVAEILGALTE